MYTWAQNPTGNEQFIELNSLKNKWKISRSRNFEPSISPCLKHWAPPSSSANYMDPGVESSHILSVNLSLALFTVLTFRFQIQIDILLTFCGTVLLCQCVSPVNSYSSSHSGGLGWQKNYLDQSLIGKGTVYKIGMSGQYEFIYGHIFLSNWLIW